MIQPGISSYTYTWAVGVPGHPPPQPLDAFGLVARAAALRVPRVQIADNCPLDALPDERLAALAALARQHAITLEVGTRGLTPQNLKRHLDIAATLHAPLVRMVVDAPGVAPAPDEIVALARAAVPELARRSIVLALENHDRFPARTYARMIERIGSPHVGICLDTVNSLGAGDGFDTVLDALAPHTVNLHVKDYTVTRASHKMGFVVEGTPAGKGMLPLISLIALLTGYGRCASAIIELWTPPDASLDATLRREAAWADESVAHLAACLAAVREADYVYPSF